MPGIFITSRNSRIYQIREQKSDRRNKGNWKAEFNEEIIIEKYP